MSAIIREGDCLAVMRGMPDCSIDAVICDPPYELNFMSRAWDRTGVAFDPATWAEALRIAKPGAHLLAFGGSRTFHRIAVAIEDAGWEIRDTISWLYGSGFPKSHNLDGDWKGWGTALKPAWEPIIVARKPFKGTVAANVQRYGTGAVNVDACRIGDENTLRTSNAGTNGDGWGMGTNAHVNGSAQGRWPANVTLDEGAAAMLDAQTGPLTSGAMCGQYKASSERAVSYGSPGLASREIEASSGGASRFFYCAKASTAERGEGNTHPTVKPLKLLSYLCRLVTPPGGTVLDPFAGSGTTGIAAITEGFDFIGIEKEPEYAVIARARIAAAAQQPALVGVA